MILWHHPNNFEKEIDANTWRFFGYHPGADLLLRGTQPIGIHNQQCGYEEVTDSNGNITHYSYLENGSGAGTPDFAYHGEWYGYGHGELDMNTWKDIKSDNDFDDDEVWTIYNKYWKPGKCE